MGRYELYSNTILKLNRGILQSLNFSISIMGVLSPHRLLWELEREYI